MTACIAWGAGLYHDSPGRLRGGCCWPLVCNHTGLRMRVKSPTIIRQAVILPAARVPHNRQGGISRGFGGPGQVNLPDACPGAPPSYILPRWVDLHVEVRSPRVLCTRLGADGCGLLAFWTVAANGRHSTASKAHMAAAAAAGSGLAGAAPCPPSPPTPCWRQRCGRRGWDMAWCAVASRPLPSGLVSPADGMTERTRYWGRLRGRSDTRFAASQAP